jgi:deoxycytidine triphosphate deaminase
MPTVADKRATLLERLNQLKPLDEDPFPDVHGVLLSDQIEYYATYANLITPFARSNLKPAAYELTIGDEYFIGGEYVKLGAGESTISILPFQVVVIKTNEIVCLPRFIIGRWNIRVKHAYAGLLWVGGPQVDPGYVGHLFCPIYNLSDKPVTLLVDDAIAVIDFCEDDPV